MSQSYTPVCTCHEAQDQQTYKSPCLLHDIVGVDPASGSDRTVIVLQPPSREARVLAAFKAWLEDYRTELRQHADRQRALPHNEMATATTVCMGTAIDATRAALDRLEQDIP